MTSCVVLVPVLGRPHRVQPTLDSVRRTAPHARVLFIADHADHDEIQAIRRANAEFVLFDGSYAAKINHGVQVTDERLLFLGADDLEWSDGWLQACEAHVRRGADVVGVNDLCAPRTQRGDHATHFLMTRGYAEAPTIDGGPGPLCELYDHSCCDDELVAVARARGVLVIDPTIIVEHLHPDARKAPVDDTYRKGREHIRADRRLFRSRMPLWT